ncbi:hypothetical protein AUC61_21495 [Pseudomonas sp. S25]|uniref:Uncharacterized protein n=1 Tax=Pseudomonas maioricensis TaxID=1766623 RepID=A0ABS9ZNF3_9PSED|nr:hypothetical protein [Pseudomonas sp. S25]MCI8212111.1 hypothetical protein [Pseudomonas sp. S25]
MKRAILPAIFLTALWVNVVQADNQSAASIPSSGSPGTATPTPYPQVVPSGPPLINGTQGSGPLLPKVELPQPPKGQPVPGQDPNAPTPMPPRPK